MKYSGHFGPLVRFEIISCRQGSLSMWRWFIASHVLPSQTWKNRTISHHIASHFPHDRTLPILRPKVIVKILSSLSIMKQSIFFNDLLSLRSFETEFLLVSFVPYTLTSFFALILVYLLYMYSTLTLQYFCSEKIHTILQSIMNAKLLSDQIFWLCHDRGLAKTIPTIPPFSVAEGLSLF